MTGKEETPGRCELSWGPGPYRDPPTLVLREGCPEHHKWKPIIANASSWPVKAHHPLHARCLTMLSSCGLLGVLQTQPSSP